MVGESFCKYETKVACGQDGLHSCGGLAREGLIVIYDFMFERTGNHDFQ